MLCLSRFPDEEIYIDGDRIKLKVLSVRGGLVRIGVDAAADVLVARAGGPGDGWPLPRKGGAPSACTDSTTG